MGIAEVRKEIRRALEIPLNAAAAANSLTGCIQWPGRTFDRVEKPIYLAVEINWGDVRVTEMGPAPRFEANGGLTIVVHTPSYAGADESDRVSKIAATAYPYAVPLVFGGVTVHVDKITPGAYGFDGAWLTSLMTIDWQVFRRP